MKFSNSLPAAAAIAMTCAALAGCTSHGVSEQTKQKLTYVQTEVGLGRATVTETTASLKMLREADNTQISAAIDNYGKSVQNLEDKAAGVGLVLNMTTQRAANFFDKWDKSITDLNDANLQQTSVERKNEMSSEFDKVHTRINALRTNFAPFMSRLKDIHRSLVADPTKAGRDAALPSIKAALDQEKSILRDIDALNKSIEELKNK